LGTGVIGSSERMVFTSGGSTSDCCAADASDKPPRVKTLAIAIQRLRWTGPEIPCLPRMVR